MAVVERAESEVVVLVGVLLGWLEEERVSKAMVSWEAGANVRGQGPISHLRHLGRGVWIGARLGDVDESRRWRLRHFEWVLLSRRRGSGSLLDQREVVEVCWERLESG